MCFFSIEIGEQQSESWLKSLNDEQIKVLSYKILTAKTLEGFGGLMRKYCPSRCGRLFDVVVSGLLALPSSDSNDSKVKSVLNKEKLTALMTNEIGYSAFYKNQIGRFCWQPLKNVDLDALSTIVGTEQFKAIETKNRGKPVVHCYRTSNKANQHGHSNYNPFLDHDLRFISYSDRQ